MTELKENLVRSAGSFDLDVNWIIGLFKVDNIGAGKSTEELRNAGGERGLFAKLNTSLKTGIADNGSEKNKRESYFGNNHLVEPPIKTLWEIFITVLDDFTLKVLMVAAVASLIIGIGTEGWSHGWYEGAAILVAISIVTSIATINDYKQEQQFRNLFRKSEKKIVKAVRDGKLKEIDAHDLLVGDIFQIATGLIMPCDAILVEKNAEFLADESQMTGESRLMKKAPDSLGEEGTSPFLISGSKIMDGNGLGLVLSVGVRSQLGILRASLETEPDKTPLQIKLAALADIIGLIGSGGAALTFIGMMLGLILTNISTGKDFFTMETVNHVLGFLVLAITIIVMAVPEGLPMAVVIALAYSVEQMRQLNNLVRDMSACETMGNCTDICSDKTGTLTQNNMTVIDVFYSGSMVSVQNGIKDNMKKDADLLDMCAISCIASTSTPDFKISMKEQTGNRTELAILDFAYKLGVDYHNLRPSENLLKVKPFSSDRKRMSAVYQKDGTKWLYVKGAPDVIVNQCSFYRTDGKTQRIDDEWKKNLDTNVLRVIGGKRARGIGVSKVEVPVSFKEEDDLEIYEKDMTFMGVFGIMDPVRDDVPKAVLICHQAGITVRMITGDNALIGAAIAKECNILPKTYQDDDDDYSVMEGKKFREAVGGLQWREEERNGKMTKVPYVQDMRTFQKIEAKLRVIGRCLPEDKLLLVTGLQTMNKVVAVTGDGANDAPALKKADVGFGMGKTGTDIAKDASDIVLLDDNFSSTVTAVKFGRNIFDAIRKFVKFQLTVNLVAMSIAIICGFVIKESPINAIQMLWINVIMDSFASLALATEPPTDELLRRAPTKKAELIITEVMWRAITFQSICQLIILFVILFNSYEWLGIPSSINVEEWTYENAQHYTFFFNCFVFFQMFNFINARVLKREERNPFQNICSNPIFWFIIALTFSGQVIFIQFIGRPVKCSPLSLEMHLYSLAIGSLSLPIALLEKLIPEKFLPIPQFLKENPDANESVFKSGIASKARGTFSNRKSGIYRD